MQIQICACAVIGLVLGGLTALPAAEPSAKEQELLAVLRSDAPAAEKAITCKRLAIAGSAASVGDLARLLENEQLASWARIALEAIPGPESDAALRHASHSLTGRLLVGVINSLGVRRDAQSVDLLIVRLDDQDPEVVAAAAVALGRIGVEGAVKALRQRLAATVPGNVRAAAAEGAVLCAERLALSDAAAATLLYDEIRKADVPRPRIREATRGAILTRPADAGMDLLVEQLRSEDYDLFQIGLSTAREFPGKAIDVRLASELVKAKPERAALLVQAMADRRDSVVLSAIVRAAEDGARDVRLSAIQALERVGDASCLSALLTIGVEADGEIRAAARKTLGVLPGTEVNAEILKRLSRAEGTLYPLLIEVVGQRRIQATAELTKAIAHREAAVRQAALLALGTTVPAKQLSLLIKQAVAPGHEEDTDIARKALMTACVRMPDRDACAADVARALEQAPVATQAALLPVLGAVGGTQSLQTLASYARRNEPELQDVSSRLLGEWMTIDAADVLLDLSQSAPEDKYKVRALRGYIRIARQFVMPEAERVVMCERALDAARQINEQKLVLEVLKRYPSVGTLRLAMRVGQDQAELKTDAQQAALAIAQKLGPKGAEVLELIKQSPLGPVKLEIVKAEYGAGSSQADVTRVLQQRAGDRQFIELPQANYNEAFGGDPAPNVVKVLKVHYRIDGKDGQATFAENALILLPIPGDAARRP